VTSGCTLASVRRKCEAEDSSPLKQKMCEWTDKDLHRNISAGSSAGGQTGTKYFYLKYSLGNGRKHCNDLFIFSFTN